MMLGCILPLLLQGLKDPGLALSATLSLKDVCSECQLHLLPYAEQILTAAKVSKVVNVSFTFYPTLNRY